MAGGLLLALVEGDDLDPIRALAGRIASDRLKRTAPGIDRVRRDRVRLLAGNENEAAGLIGGKADMPRRGAMSPNDAMRASYLNSI